MTYGWAILIVLIALGTLFYLGLFDSSDKITTTCQLPAPLSCQSARIDEKGVTLEVGLMKGFSGTITQIEVSDQACTDVLNGVLSEGKITTVRCTKSGLAKGDNPVITVKADTSKINGRISHSVEGTVQGTTEKAAILTDPTLLAKYSFENNVNDLSGNNYHGTKGSAVTYVVGKSGTSCQFDGSTNSYISVSYNPNLMVRDIVTYAMWIYPTEDIDSDILHNHWGRPYRLEYKRTCPNPPCNPARTTKLVSPGFQVQIGAGPDGAEKHSYSLDNSVPLNSWTHIAVVIDAANKYSKIYINGQEADSITFTEGALIQNDAQTSTKPLYFGKADDGSLRFKGKIDEVYIYHKALSQSEIQSLA